MGNNTTFFIKRGLDPLTQKEYIYLVDYKFKHPQENLFLCIQFPEQKNHFTHLLACAGIPVDLMGALRGEPVVVDDNIITDDLLSYPFHNSIEYMSRGITTDTCILDIGCGDKAMSNQFLMGKVTTIDAYEKFNPDILHDLTQPLPLQTASYDVALLLDVIEHLNKEDGYRLLDEIQRVVRKRFFVLTPLFWRENEEETSDPGSPYYRNTYNLHHSLWKPEDFKNFTRVHNPIMTDYFFGYWEKK